MNALEEAVKLCLADTPIPGGYRRPPMHRVDHLRHSEADMEAIHRWAKAWISGTARGPDECLRAHELAEDLGRRVEEEFYAIHEWRRIFKKRSVVDNTTIWDDDRRDLQVAIGEIEALQAHIGVIREATCAAWVAARGWDEWAARSASAALKLAQPGDRQKELR